MKRHTRLFTTVALFVSALCSPFSNGALLSQAHASGALVVTYRASMNEADGSGTANDPSTYNAGDTVTVLARPSAPTFNNPANGYFHFGASFVGWCTSDISYPNSCASAGGTLYQVGDTFVIQNSLTLYAAFLPEACNLNTTQLTQSQQTVYEVAITSTDISGCTYNLPFGVNRADVLVVAPGANASTINSQNYAGGGGSVRVFSWVNNPSSLTIRTLEAVVGRASQGTSQAFLDPIQGNISPKYAINFNGYLDTQSGPTPNDSSSPYILDPNFLGGLGVGVPTADQSSGDSAGAGQWDVGTFPSGGSGVQLSQISGSPTPINDAGLFSTDTTCYGGGGAIINHTTNQTSIDGVDGCGTAAPVINGQSVTFTAPAANSGTGASTVIVDGTVSHGPAADGLIKIRYTLAPHAVVTYDGNGATSGSAPDIQDFFPNLLATVQGRGSLVRQGAEFVSWCTVPTTIDQSCDAAGGTEYGPLTTRVISTDTTLYAMWETVYHVTYFANGATSGSVPPSTPYSLHGSQPIVGNDYNLALSGAAYVSWCTVPTTLNQSCSAAGGIEYYGPGRPQISSDLNLYAVWATALSVTYFANGGTGTVPVDSSNPYSPGARVSVLSGGQLSNNPYNFAGWCTVATQPDQACFDAGGTRYLPDFIDGSFRINSNVNLYAVWSSLSSNTDIRTLSFTGGTLSPALTNGNDTYTVSVAPGVTSVTFSADPVDHRSLMLYVTPSMDATTLNPLTLSDPIEIGSTDTTTVGLAIGVFAEQGLGLQDPSQYLRLLSVTFVHSSTVNNAPPPVFTIPSTPTSPVTPVAPATPPAITPTPATIPASTAPVSLVITPGGTSIQQLPTTAGTTWAVSSGSTQAAITVSPTGAITIAPDQAPGKYVVNLVATDSSGAQTSQAVTVVVPGTPKVVITTSPTGVPMVAVTDPVDDAPKLAIISTDKGVSATISNTGAVAVNDPTFSGNLNVQLQASNQYGLSATAAVKVTVNPTDITEVAANVSTKSVQAKENALAKTSTIVTWQPAPNAIAYQVKVDGKVVGETSASTLNVANVYGPSHTVEVIPLGNDGTVGNAIATQIPVKSIAVGSLTFKGTSSTLTPSQKKILSSLAKSAKAGGITKITLNGIVESAGATISNKALAAARANAVKSYLQSKVTGSAIKFVVTANKKAVAIKKSSGTNRVDVVVR